MGKRGRKTIRSVKRARYAVSFEQRYGMNRKAWPLWKKEHTAQEVHNKRVRATI